MGINAQGVAIHFTDAVTFDADFECSNVDQIRRKSMNVYDVFIRNDSNGNQNLQWFYFRMKNSADFVERITINIVNFTKGNSLFGAVSEIVEFVHRTY